MEKGLFQNETGVGSYTGSYTNLWMLVGSSNFMPRFLPYQDRAIIRGISKVLFVRLFFVPFEFY